MIYKFCIASMVAFLGFCLMPNLSFACENKAVETENTCCQKPTQNIENEHCKNLSDNDDTATCGRDCEKEACQCTNFVQYFAVSLIPNFKACLSPIPTKQLYFSKNDNAFSSGFYSIWLPPKIG